MNKQLDPNDDPDIFETADDADEAMKAAVGEMYDKMLEDDDDDDDGGFDQPFDEPDDERAAVSAEEGIELAQKALLNKGAENPEEDGEASKGEEDQEEEPSKQEAEKEEDGAEDSQPDLTSTSISDLAKDVPEAQRGEVVRRLSEAEAILKPFEAYADEIERHGTTPQGALNRMLELNAFAQSKPDEYLAWVAKEMKGDAAHEVMESAAKHLGYKLVKDDDDDDLFVDDETRRLREEVARLKGEDKPNFGPDTPERSQQRTAQQQLNDFVSARGDDGQPLHPRFDLLQSRISEMARSHVEKTGNSVTADNLAQFYKQADDEYSSAYGVHVPSNTHDQQQNGNSAAQQNAGVSDQLKKRAAAAQKARRASTSVDGSGRGADHRPALSEEADIEDVVRFFAKDM